MIHRIHLLLCVEQPQINLANALASIARSSIQPAKISLVDCHGQLSDNWEELSRFTNLDLSIVDPSAYHGDDFYKLGLNFEQNVLLFSSSNRIWHQHCFEALCTELNTGSTMAYTNQRKLQKPARRSTMDKWLLIHSDEPESPHHSPYPTFALRREEYLDLRGVSFPVENFSAFANEVYRIYNDMLGAVKVPQSLEFLQTADI